MAWLHCSKRDKNTYLIWDWWSCKMREPWLSMLIGMAHDDDQSPHNVFGLNFISGHFGFNVWFLCFINTWKSALVSFWMFKLKAVFIVVYQVAKYLFQNNMAATILSPVKQLYFEASDFMNPWINQSGREMDEEIHYVDFSQTLWRN